MDDAAEAPNLDGGDGPCPSPKHIGIATDEGGKAFD